MIFTTSYRIYRRYVRKERFVAYGFEPLEPGVWENQVRQLPELYPSSSSIELLKANKITKKEFILLYEKEILPKIDLKDYFWVRCSRSAAQNVILLTHEMPPTVFSTRKALQKHFEKNGLAVREWREVGPGNEDEYKLDVNTMEHIWYP